MSDGHGVEESTTKKIGMAMAEGTMTWTNSTSQFGLLTPTNGVGCRSRSKASAQVRGIRRMLATRLTS
jgi:hypothetical protein